MKKIKFYNPNYFYNKNKSILIKNIDDFLSNGYYLNGNVVKSFEKNFSKYIGMKYGLGVASGTDALIIAIETLGIKNSKILLLNNTFVAQAEAIIRTGNIPVFIKTNKNMGFLKDDLEKNIDSHTKVIILSHLYGFPEDIEYILSISKKNNLKIIEDCSHSHGSVYKNNKVGSFGNISIFSLNPTKILGGISDGGIILTNNKKYYNIARLISNHGRKGKDNHIIVGLNTRLSGINSLYLNFKLKKLDYIIQIRRKNAVLYFNNLSNINGVKLLNISIYDNISFYVYPVFLKTKKLRNNLRNFLSKNGVETGIHYKKLITLNYPYRNSNKSFYNDIINNELSLPIGEHLKKENIIFISKLIKKFLKYYVD